MPALSLDEARERLRPIVEKAQIFTGWTWDPQTKSLGVACPWDYEVRAKELITGAESVIDLGTGGGERFGEMLEGYGGRALATEEWHINAPVAAEHLREFGAGVIRCLSTRLPIADESFVIVLDRHEDFDPSEVARILRPGGVALTQQVWDFWPEINRYFVRRTDFGDHFQRYLNGFQAAGLTIVNAQKHQETKAYADLGDIVFLLCIAPWEVPDFDPLGIDLEAVLALEEGLSTPEGLVLSEGSYIIEARKP